MEQLGEFIVNHWILFSVLVLNILVLALYVAKGSAGGAPQLLPAEVTRIVNHQDATIIDVRDQAAYGRGHILGSLSLPLADLASRAGTVTLDRKKPVILCCQAGNTSAAAVEPLTKAGFENIYRLKGGMQEWQQSNLPVTKK
ncbi:MAG: rhodanese-like domain-containing protein [Pseudomonadota bacterium]|nr:rhodanese-like domain-containing protein [Pseudomonadota bacterium]